MVFVKGGACMVQATRSLINFGYTKDKTKDKLTAFNAIAQIQDNN